MSLQACLKLGGCVDAWTRRLRQQQLSALQCLLRTEAACIEGNPLQLSAVQQAVDLLADSLEDVHTVASTLQWDGEVCAVLMLWYCISIHPVPRARPNPCTTSFECRHRSGEPSCCCCTKRE